MKMYNLLLMDQLLKRINSMFNTAASLLPQSKMISPKLSLLIFFLFKEVGFDKNILFYLYTNTTEGNENTVYNSLILDSNTGDEYDFEDLFNVNSNFRERLSQIAIDTARRENVPFTEDYQGITNNQQSFI